MHLRAISAALAIGIVLAGAAVASRWFDARPADAFVEPSDAVYLALDCDTATAGVQDACAFPSGTTSVQVDVVLGNTTASSFELGAFNFTVAAGPQQIADPPVGADANFNSNPDFNESAISVGTWSCTPPAPDNDADADPSVAQSLLSCFNADAVGPLIAAGSTLKLATITYTTSDGPAGLAIDVADVGDVDGNPVLSCFGPNAACIGAGFSVGSAETLTPTPTETFTPTATPTFQPVKTPSGTPVGGVSEVVGLNEATCIAGLIGFHEIDAISAITSCIFSDQISMQDLVSCIRAVDVEPFGEISCGEGVPFDDEQNGLLLPVPSDFSSIDHDTDQVWWSHRFAVIAFVDGDWPVSFEASSGLILGGEEGSFLCYRPEDDPDCDSDPNTVGDGVVTAFLLSPENAAGESAVVTVTQAGVAQTLDVEFTGPPDHVELEVVGGKDTIRTGAAQCHDADVPWHFEELKDLAKNGVVLDDRTVVIARVYDAFGHQLSSSLLDWAPSYTEGTLDPLGGGSSAGVLTMDLGSAGVGAVQVVCSRDQVGDLQSSATVNEFFEPNLDPDVVGTITIHVVDELPTATATASPTASATATDTETPLPTETPTETP
ncbi:MAG TPA: hypothetical protein VFH62_08775, partial [Dehalococcoidia bacterium]|nr:hypothetical protein [Dehalococcoidia bacterium]